MKTYFAYLLFLSFALRPVYNIAYVAYFELNIDYIIETYCVNKEKPELKCNGKCHLASQLSLDNNKDETPSYLASFYDAFFPVYFQDYKTDYILCSSIVSIEKDWLYNSLFTSLYIECLDPPPKV